eukprot:c7620_g1_i1.p1 GENE.c7620_g1_i1~~c7620_g1_i1.p1  ORF type:complete len:425 (+),score=106.86 c7620_g1_i1:26-1276(+)
MSVVELLLEMDRCIDTFFPVDPQEKIEVLRQKADALLEACRHLQGDSSINSRALYQLCLGRAADISDVYNPIAEVHLTKAVKLNPDSVDAWNALAECYWKKKNYDFAKTCFTAAIKVVRNKVSLRRLSMIHRILINENQHSLSPLEFQEELAKSMEMAKEAISMDIKDGVSWYVMGNALMGQFFGVKGTGGQTQYLRHAIKAYNQAESLLGDSQIPDLFYNRANIETYLQDYGRAVLDYSKAHNLDPSLNALERRSALIAFLRNCEAILEIKRSEKKVGAVAQRLSRFSQCDDFRTLRAGENAKRTVRASVLQTIPDFDGLGSIHIVVDRFSNQHLIHISNVCSTIRSGSVLTVSAPLVNAVDLQNEGVALNLKIISVLEPLKNLLVDGQSISDGDLTRPQASISQPDRADLRTVT